MKTCVQKFVLKEIRVTLRNNYFVSGTTNNWTKLGIICTIFGVKIYMITSFLIKCVLKSMSGFGVSKIFFSPYDLSKFSWEKIIELLRDSKME